MIHWYNVLCRSTEYLLSVVRSLMYHTYDVGSLEYILSVVLSFVYFTYDVGMPSIFSL